MANAVTTQVDSGSAAATLTIYSGTRPANANTALSGNTALATFTLNSTAFGAASSGVITLAGTPLTVVASNTGTAVFFRVATGGTGGAGVCFDGDVATSGSDLNLNSTSITSGVNVTISSGTFTAPAT